MSAYVAKHLENRQKAWNEATQSRIAATTSTLEGIKSLKIMGMEDAVQSQILHLRSKEIQISKPFRWILVAYNASGMYRFERTDMLSLMLTSFPSKCTWDPRSSFDSNPLRYVFKERSIAGRSDICISCSPSYGHTSS